MDFSGKKILLLGFGGEAKASLAYLTQHFSDLNIGVADQSPHLVLSSDEQKLISTTHLGDAWLDQVDSYDVAIRSPGIPLEVRSSIYKKNPAICFTTGTEIFIREHRHRIWGVTGTKGKSTTSSLLYQCLKALDIDAILCGNIGIPALSLIDKTPEVFVMELSSYQLEDCSNSPHGAIFLNLFSEHLDHHGSHSAYREAKQAIFSHQSKNDLLILPHRHETLVEGAGQLAARKSYFGSTMGSSWVEDDCYMVRLLSGEIKKICHTSETRLRGPGNQQNILAVLAAISHFDCDITKISSTIKNFEPLPHRLEEVGTFHGITFINDSISTVPEATINALETFGTEVKTLILGGFDRGLSYAGLADYLKGSSVENIILFPPSGDRIQCAIETSLPGRHAFFKTDSMSEAVKLAFQHTIKPGICLLSPASPSFPIFKNFEERGRLFRSIVNTRGES